MTTHLTKLFELVVFNMPTFEDNNACMRESADDNAESNITEVIWATSHFRHHPIKKNLLNLNCTNFL